MFLPPPQLAMLAKMTADSESSGTPKVTAAASNNSSKRKFRGDAWRSSGGEATATVEAQSLLQKLEQKARKCDVMHLLVVLSSWVARGRVGSGVGLGRQRQEVLLSCDECARVRVFERSVLVNPRPTQVSLSLGYSLIYPFVCLSACSKSRSYTGNEADRNTSTPEFTFRG